MNTGTAEKVYMLDLADQHLSEDKSSSLLHSEAAKRDSGEPGTRI